MYISTQTLVSYSKINIEIINHIISIGSELVPLHKDISIINNNLGIPETNYKFTKVDILNGLTLIKEFCTENKCLDLYFKYALSVLNDREESLEIHKEKKQYEINKVKEDSLKTIFHKGHIFQTEPKDKDSMQRRINVMSTDDIVIWLDMNNNPISFTSKEFKDFFKEIVNLEQDIILTAAKLKNGIKECKSIEELNTIEWPTKLN